MTPRPFDKDRDGLVCGEGSGLVVLEDYERAIKRNAKIYAEITGYSTTANGLHVSQSNMESMVVCMRQALRRRRDEVRGDRLYQCPRHGDHPGRPGGS